MEAEVPEEEEDAMPETNSGAAYDADMSEAEVLQAADAYDPADPDKELPELPEPDAPAELPTRAFGVPMQTKASVRCAATPVSPARVPGLLSPHSPSRLA